jgi:hypothetical protein
MESLLRSLKVVYVYIIDILVTDATLEEHSGCSRLAKAGIQLNRIKCSFLQPEIQYLGHRLNAKGLQPTDEKVAALAEAPIPTNVTQLRSFLGIVNYYGKFLPNLSSKLKPLYNLLCKDKKWVWTSCEDAAFKLAKDALQSDPVLVHYDGKKKLVLACDASEYGIGAVLSHVFDNGDEKPIVYARTLNIAERRYSQLECKGLAIVFGVPLESDHQPFSHLFSETKGIPAMASARIQRWALMLAAYQCVQKPE